MVRAQQGAARSVEPRSQPQRSRLATAATHEHRFLDAKEELAALDLPEESWETVVLEHRNRPVTSPSGEEATLEVNLPEGTYEFTDGGDESGELHVEP